MKNSGLKKSKLQSQMSHHKIQSKLLISKQINTHSTNFITKIDHIRQQQQFLKEYNLKFLTDRKRIRSNQKSQPKLSNSKLKVKQSREKHYIQPKSLFQSTNDYRVKFNELNEEYLEEKHKFVDNQKKLLNIELSLCNFLSNPNTSHAQQLINLLENRNISQFLKRIIQKTKEHEYFSNIVRQSMKILQIQQSDDIIKNLRVRIQKFRTLDECTFRILQLQSFNKKLMQQYEQKNRKLKRDYQQRINIQTKQYKEEIDKINKSTLNKEDNSNEAKQVIKLIIHDLNQIIRGAQKDYIIQSNISQINQIHEIAMNYKEKLRQVQVQAQFTQFKLLESNQDLVRIQRFMSLLKDDMSSQIQEQQQKNQKHLEDINQLQNLIQDMNNQMNTLKNQIKYLKQKINQKQQQIHDEHILLSASLGIKQNNPSKIVLKIQQNGKHIKQLQQIINEKAEDINTKDQKIKSIQSQLQKRNIHIQQLKQTARLTLLDKQQYKFLLNNIRDQMSEIRKNHLQQKSRIIQQKDEQIINSNKDILFSYSQLNDENKLTKTQLLKLKIHAQQLQIKKNRYEKKLSQLQQILYQRQNKLKKLDIQNDRYKQQLRQFENQFNKLADLSQLNSKKILTLQKQNSQQCKLISISDKKIKQLQNNNSQLIFTRNQLKTQMNKLLYDIKQLRQQRIKLQSANMQIRLDLLNKQSQINKLQEQNKNYYKQIKIIKNNNQKLTNDLNSITKKYIMNRIDLSKRVNKKFNIILQQCKLIKKQNINMKILLKQYKQKQQNFTLKIHQQLQIKIIQFQNNKQNKKIKQLQEQIKKSKDKYLQKIKKMQLQIQNNINYKQQYQQNIKQYNQNIILLKNQNQKIQSKVLALKEQNQKLINNQKLNQTNNLLLKQKYEFIEKQIQNLKNNQLLLKRQNQTLKINQTQLKLLKQNEELVIKQIQNLKKKQLLLQDQNYILKINQLRLKQQKQIQIQRNNKLQAQNQKININKAQEEQKLHQLNLNLNKFINKKEQLQKQIKQIQIENKKMRQQNNQLNLNLQKHINERKQLQIYIKNIQEQNTNLRQDYDKLSQTLGKNINQKEQLKHYANQIKEKNIQLQQLQQKHQQIIKQLAKFKQCQKQQQNNERKDTKQNQQLNKINKQILQKLNIAQNQIAQLQNQNKSAKNSIILLQYKIKQKFTQLLDINNKNEQITYKNEQLQSKIILLQNQIKQLKNIIKQFQIKHKLKNEQVQSYKLQEKVQSDNKQIIKLKNQLQKLQQRIIQLQQFNKGQYNKVVEQSVIKSRQISCQCFILPSDLKQQIYLKLTNILTSISLLNSQKLQIQEYLCDFSKFNIEQIYQFIFQQISKKEKEDIKQNTNQIDVIMEQNQSFQDESLVNSYKQNSIPPEQTCNKNIQADVINSILEILIQSQTEIPKVAYWEKIQSNFLIIRRKLFKRPLNLKLDISSIDFKDSLGGLHSPQSNYFIEAQLTRRVGTEPDQLNQARYFKQTNRSQKPSYHENIEKDNQELKIILNEQFQKINTLQIEISQLKSKMVSQLNETSIKGLQYNFKKILDYLIAENIDLFQQTCRIVMKMLQFSHNQIKDYQQKLQAKKKKKKTGILAGFFN